MITLLLGDRRSWYRLEVLSVSEHSALKGLLGKNIIIQAFAYPTVLWYIEDVISVVKV